MMMENKVKQKLCGMFRSSLDSCRSKSISDVEQPFFFPQNRHHHHQLIQLFSPKPPPPPSFCTPQHKNRAISDRRSSLLPAPPPNTLFDDCNPRPKHRRHRSKSRKTRQKNKEKFDEFFSSVAADYYGCYSSEDEKKNTTSKFDDDTTFFSSKSMSCLKSERWNELTKICSPKLKHSFAVIKRSSDPYNDFRTSMVEMIVEKQIFGSKDLENLLQCFLSLNSLAHHRLIIQVFIEIWETLFSDWN